MEARYQNGGSSSLQHRGRRHHRHPSPPEAPRMPTGASPPTAPMPPASYQQPPVSYRKPDTPYYPPPAGGISSRVNQPPASSFSQQDSSRQYPRADRPRSHFRTSSNGSTRNAFYPHHEQQESYTEVAPSTMMEPRSLQPGQAPPADSMRYSNDPGWMAAMQQLRTTINNDDDYDEDDDHLNGQGMYNSLYFRKEERSQQTPSINHQFTDDSSYEKYELHHMFHDSMFFQWYSDSPAAKVLRKLLYDPDSPEFTELQMFSISILLGIFMGVSTAWWKRIIEAGVDFIWVTIPEFLLQYNLLSVHYVWWVPAIIGGIVSYFSAVCDFLPDQNEWIVAVHSRGIPIHRDFSEWATLLVLSTAGMWSGLSLGPELPLVLTSSVVGSWLAVATGQSILQARVLNLTAASAAVGGFFGFPMAGSLFVLELPHRMGLQYFEALSPGIMASIVAVLTNRLVTGDDVTGYFKYPFLTTTLPSSIFYCAVFYGIFGCVVGQAYAETSKYLKKNVHDWFHEPHDDHAAQSNGAAPAAPHNGESSPLLRTNGLSAKSKKQKKQKPWWVISHEPKRAAVAGALAGAITGGVSIFFPHLMFWGEAQLQNLIDKGRTPLPVFGEDTESAKVFTQYSLCMIDNDDEAMIQAGFGIGCSLAIAVLKTLVIGLSLGTGIVGGHFWGPLYVGCAASHWLTDMVHSMPTRVFDSLAAHPCVVILCTMGAAHVVTFRAHTAIMLILTLTISAFNPESDDGSYDVAGDYSAVFPLLVVSVFLSLHASRKTIFYPTQKGRGDISAIPEVLCAPGQVGAPLVVGYEEVDENLSSDGDSSSDLPDNVVDEELAASNRSTSPFNGGFHFNGNENPEAAAVRREIEREFEQTSLGLSNHTQQEPSPGATTKDVFVATESSLGMLTSSRLDELLASGSKNGSETPPVAVPKANHRRTKSAPLNVQPDESQPPKNSHPLLKPVAAVSAFVKATRERTESNGSKASLVMVQSFGIIEETQHQPSLLDQARMRSASSHRRVPSLQHKRSGSLRGGRSRSPSVNRTSSRPSHSRKPSDASRSSYRVYDQDDGLDDGALTMDDIAQSFGSLIGRPPSRDGSFSSSYK